MQPLPPLEPLPSLFERKRQRRRLLSWATLVAVLCAIAVGIFHGIGNKIFEAAWTYLFHR